MKPGMIFLLLAIFGYGSWGFFAKVAQSRGITWGPLQLLTALGSMLVAMAFCVPFIDWKEALAQRAGLAAGLACGITVALGNIAFYKAIEDVKVSLAIPILALNVLVTLLLATWILKEKISVVQWVGAVLAVTAVVLLSWQPKGM